MTPPPSKRKAKVVRFLATNVLFRGDKAGPFSERLKEENEASSKPEQSFTLLAANERDGVGRSGVTGGGDVVFGSGSNGVTLQFFFVLLRFCVLCGVSER